MGDLRSARSVDNTKNPHKHADRRSAWGRHILKTFIRNGREWQYHATKGWRNYRVVK